MNGTDAVKNRGRVPGRIVMIWNGLTLCVMLAVGITFLVGSRMPADAEPEIPGIIRALFTVFDLLLVLSPLTLIATALLSVLNALKKGSKQERFLPLGFGLVVQGILSALFLSGVMQAGG